MGSHHPEQPARLTAINDRLLASGLDRDLQRYTAPLAGRELLQACHDPAYVEHVFSQSPQQGLAWLDGDTAMNPYSLQAALRAAGGAAMAVDHVIAGTQQRAFCAVRPPGHHAERMKAMGFCLFNNVAVAAYHALNEHGLRRVAIVDFDVHHGNGTEDIVSGDSRILFCSTFQHPFYPYSGAGNTADNVVNSPLDANVSGAAFRRVIERAWLPRLADFAPELILVSAGFDAHRDDPLGGCNLLEDDYAWVTGKIVEQARISASGRVVSLLEGGYDLQALASSVEAHLGAMLSDS